MKLTFHYSKDQETLREPISILAVEKPKMYGTWNMITLLSYETLLLIG